MRLRISIRGRVRPSIRRSVPSYFRTTTMADFVDVILNNGTMSDNEVVASYVPPRYLFFCADIKEKDNKCKEMPQTSRFTLMFVIVTLILFQFLL